MKNNKFVLIELLILAIALMMVSCADATLDAAETHNPSTESEDPINSVSPSMVVPKETERPNSQPSIIPSNTATDAPTVRPTQTPTDIPTETPIPTLVQQRELTDDEYMFLANLVAPILIDPAYNGPLKWEDRNYYKMCEVLYRYMDKYGSPEQLYLEDEQRIDYVYSYFNTLAYSERYACPQFDGADWSASTGSWSKLPPVEPYPNLEWSQDDEGLFFPTVLNILADPRYPGSEFPPFVESVDLICDIFFQNLGVYGYTYWRTENPDFLWALMKKNLVDNPAKEGKSPICIQFSDYVIVPTPTATSSGFVVLDSWTDEDAGFVFMLWLDIASDPEYDGPLIDDPKNERFEACQIIWDYGKEFGLSGGTAEEKWDFILDFLWTDEGYLCPQFEGLR
jgi:hypothetical protein